MRILFVYTTVEVRSSRQPLRSLQDIHLGLSQISACLKQAGHETRLAVLCSWMPRKSRNVLTKLIAEFDPHIIAFTAVTTQYPFIQSLARDIRRTHPRRTLVVGGVHASLNPEPVIGDAFDAVCVGEGEQPLTELANRLEAGKDFQTIANLWVKDQHGSIFRNNPRPLIQDLDALPVIDREMWRPWTQEDVAARHVVLLGRGCPFDCSYCVNHAYRQLAEGQYVRYRSPANILAEIRQLKESEPERSAIYLQAETIALNRTWTLELCRRLKAYNDRLANPIKYVCNFRINSQYRDAIFFETLRAANILTIEIGLESGSARIRREILNRNYANEEFLQTVQLARQAGLRIHVYNMIGLPDETPADYAETVRLNHQANPDNTINSVFFPYPGTRLHQYCLTQGYLKPSYGATVDLERRKAFLDMPQFSSCKVQHAYDWFEFNVYCGLRPWYYRWRKVLRNKCRANLLANYLWVNLMPIWHSARHRLKLESNV